MLLDGNRVAAEIRAEVKKEVDGLETKPCLAVFLCSDDPASKIYVGKKVEACAEVGWHHEVFSGWSRVRRVNLMWIHGFRRPMPWYPGSLRLLHEYLEGAGTVADVLDLDAGGGHVVSAMWHGIWSGQIDCDLDSLITRTIPLVIHQPADVSS